MHDKAKAPRRVFSVCNRAAQRAASKRSEFTAVAGSLRWAVTSGVIDIATIEAITGEQLRELHEKILAGAIAPTNPAS